MTRGEWMPDAADASADSAVTWYFDVVSPFAYLAFPAVLAVARRRPVLFRPIVFAAVLAH